MSNIQVTNSPSPNNARSESCIAINPLENSQIVGASKKFIDPSHYQFTLATYYSSDGGASWNDSSDLKILKAWQVSPNGWPILSDPSLAWDISGNVYLLALGGFAYPIDKTKPVDPYKNPLDPKTISLLGIAVYKSTDGGKKWGNPKLVHSGGDDKQWISGDRNNGNLYAAWDGPGGLNFARSLDEGNSWSGIKNQPAGSVLDAKSFSPETIIAPNGDLYIVYVVGRQVKFVKSVDSGDSFPPAPNGGVIANIYPKYGLLPNATFRLETLATGCAGPNGTVVVAWPDVREKDPRGNPKTRIYYCVSQDGGNTWLGPNPLQPASSIPDNLHHFCPQLICNSSGMVGCSFYEYGPKTNNNNLIDVKLCLSKDKGNTFSTPVTITDSPWDPSIDAPIDEGGNTFIGDYFGLDADNSDGFYPFWTDTRTGIQELWVDNYRSLFTAASVENLRIIRGTVNHFGNQFAGQGFTPSKLARGLYYVKFDLPFPDYPSATATQVFNGNSKSHKPLDLTVADGTGGDTRDNAVIVWITVDAMLVLTGNKDGDSSDRPFSFIVMGPQ